ncbi:Activin_recp domain-containing protein [Caenorhabditis elegans]|uniref:Activin_recp domain-containing protein n=1 Tax=Caenorhabditis elegans TaxID=6239 RepID=E3CTH7_CAEEL|nr:Activin_recp domain-containing protein [Caenorhabditis elegans]CBX53347.1 Activin_recp domain-containing protein [Caenorhabditis elegans]|eukprot:NP_001256912.1 Uncharacterized protein CELE_Y38H6A.5 [Caenorhabditis elegans]
MHYLPIILFSFLLLPRGATSIECYSGSQLQVINCPSMSCIKQTLGLDTVRYCDGTGVSSICQTYRIVETCDTIPNLGYICCCGGDLCNSSMAPTLFLSIFVAIYMFF